MSIAEPTFVLGLGAQKAGTTWLYEYLRDAPQFHPGFRKEYHIWDLVDPPLEPIRRKAWLARATVEVERLGRGDTTSGGPLHLAAMFADPERYFGYFAGLLRGPVVATGDLTPSYAFLPVERLERIRAGFVPHDVRTTAIFLMRDPVDRIWSAARMYAAQPKRSLSATELRDDAGAVLLNLYAKPLYESRTRYDQTLTALDAVFGREECFVGLYEQLFTTESTSAICDLAGIAHHAPAVSRRVNATTRDDSALPEHVEREVAQHYAPVYEAVAARLTDVDLPSVWPSARWVL